MTPAEKKLVWIDARVREEQGRVDGSMTSALLRHFGRRVATLRVLTRGRATSGQEDEIDSMAEALGWRESEGME
jgi:hypothetical protein